MSGKPPSGREAELLSILMKQPLGAWGASLARDYATTFGHELNPGAVYVLMDRLERKGFVESSWGEPTAERGGRRKRMYVIKNEGRLAMAEGKPARSSGFLRPALGSAL